MLHGTACVATRCAAQCAEPHGLSTGLLPQMPEFLRLRAPRRHAVRTVRAQEQRRFVVHRARLQLQEVQMPERLRGRWWPSSEGALTRRAGIAHVTPGREFRVSRFDCLGFRCVTAVEAVGKRCTGAGAESWLRRVLAWICLCEPRLPGVPCFFFLEAGHGFVEPGLLASDVGAMWS